MALSPEEQAAAARLQTINGGNYDATDNPGGLANGGHRVNFEPGLHGVALLGQATAREADSAAASAASAAGQSAALSGTSATTIEIGVGGVELATQAGKAFQPGSFVLITSDADPVTHYMAGQVTAYAGTSLVVLVTTAAGSGMHGDWTIRVAGAVGPRGETGEKGEGTGDVIGPDGGVADGEFVVFGGTTGKLLAGSGKTSADFATAVQGGLADTALQPAALDAYTPTSDLAAVALSGGYSDLDGVPALGALAAKDAVATGDIAATGAPSGETFLRGDGAWASIAPAPKQLISHFSQSSTLSGRYIERASVEIMSDGLHSPYACTRGDPVEWVRAHLAGPVQVASVTLGPPDGTEGWDGYYLDWHKLQYSADGGASWVTLVEKLEGFETSGPFQTFPLGQVCTDIRIYSEGQIDETYICVSEFTVEGELLETSPANVAEIRAGSDPIKYPPVKPLWDAHAPVALTDAATITMDMAAGINFTVTMAGNRTLGNPSNMRPGQSGWIRVARAGTQTLSFAASWKGGADIPETGDFLISYACTAPTEVVFTVKEIT